MHRSLPVVLVVLALLASWFDAVALTPATQPATPTPSETASGGPVAVTDPLIDADQTLIDALIMSLLVTPAGGPLDKQFDLHAIDTESLSAGVRVRDFYAELKFITPSAEPSGTWMMGFCFWFNLQDGCYELSIERTHASVQWVLGHVSPVDPYQRIDSGPIPAGSFDLTPGTLNNLGLVVYNGSAILADNNFQRVAAFRLPGTPIVGDVQARAGFTAQNSNDPGTLSMSILEFQVWDMADFELTIFPQETPGAVPLETPTPLSPGLPTAPSIPTATTLPPPDLTPTLLPPPGPVATSASVPNSMLNLLFARERSAAMAQPAIIDNDSMTTTQTSNGFTAQMAGVSLADFYLTATFVNPDDTSTPWDVGIGFRDIGDNQEFRFVLDSQGDWFLTRGVETPFDFGSIVNFDPNPGALNTIEIIVRGASGMAAINGTVLNVFDLSAALAPCDMYIASGLFQGDVVEGREIDVQRISVYPLAA